jgi:ankyrin repeat protein
VNIYTGKTLNNLPPSVLLNIVKHLGDRNVADISRLSKVSKYLSNTFTPMLNQQGLRYAAKRNKFRLLKRFLKAGANPNWPFWFETGELIFQKPPLGAALQEAAYKGSVRAVEALLDAGADIDAQDCCGDTALHRAVFGGNFDVVLCLIARGANLGARDLFDFTPFDIAAEKGHTKIAYCLLRKGYDPCPPSEPTGSTALHKAIECDSEDITEILLMFNADVNARDWCGATPLILAIRKKKPLRVIKLLLKKLPDLEIRDRYKRNAIFYVIERQDGIINCLLGQFYGGREFNAIIKKAQQEYDRRNEMDQRSFVGTYPGV